MKNIFATRAKSSITHTRVNFSRLSFLVSFPQIYLLAMTTTDSRVYTRDFVYTVFPAMARGIDGNSQKIIKY